MSDNYFLRLYNAIINKSYAKQIDKPKEENRGASWNSAGGVTHTFSAKLSMDAYGIHGYTHAGVKRLSQDLAALPLKLIQGYGDKAVEIQSHPVIDLIKEPSTDIDDYLFREQITIDITLSGNCYILLLGPDKPVSMVRLHPEEIRIVTDQQKGLVGYEHNSSGSVVMYPPDRIIHGKNASYEKGSQALYGTGSVQPLARELDADLNSQKLVSEATEKGRPDVLLSPKEDGDIWNKEVRRQILDQYSGMQKSGGAMVLSGQVNVDILQLSPREMEFQASRTFARESISAVLGIPPSVLGLPTANYATSKQASVEYWSNQVKRGKRIALLFTRIARLWGDDLHFEHDYSDVEALQSVRDAKLARVEKHVYLGIPLEAAYSYEGLEFPRMQKDADDIGEEEDENVRIMKYLDYISQENLTNEVKLFSSEELNIEVVNIPSNPQVQSEEEIQKSILGSPPNWKDYKEAYLFFNSNQDQMKEGYYIRIGRRLNTDDILNAASEKGKVAIFKDLLDLAVDHLNGRYGRPPITEEERRSAYQIIVKYFDRLEMSAPTLLDSYLSFKLKKKGKKQSLISDQKREERKRKVLWNAWRKNSQGKSEKDLYYAFRDYLNGAKKRYVKRINDVKLKGVEKGSIVFPSSLLDLLDERRELQKAVGEKWLGWWTLTGNQQLDDLYRRVGKEKPLDLVFGNREYGKKLWDASVKDITQSTGKEISRIVEKGLGEGLSTREIANNLKKSDKSGIFDLGRANRIARTEATKVVNEASVESYKQLKDVGIRVDKQWLSARDGKVRPSHAALDGTTVSASEKFALPSEFGGHEASSPATFDEVGENVNCRCTVIPIIVD